MKTNDIFSVGAAVGGKNGITVNRHGQDEAVVIIGVFADDVDPSRSSDDPTRRASINLFKFLADAVNEIV